MDAKIERALKTDGLIDITTVGRKSGKPSSKEIAFHNFDGVLYITGTPGSRDWYANLVANPQFTFHLKQSAQARLPGQSYSDHRCGDAPAGADPSGGEVEEVRLNGSLCGIQPAGGSPACIRMAVWSSLNCMLVGCVRRRSRRN